MKRCLIKNFYRELNTASYFFLDCICRADSYWLWLAVVCGDCVARVGTKRHPTVRCSTNIASTAGAGGADGLSDAWRELGPAPREQWCALLLASCRL